MVFKVATGGQFGIYELYKSDYELNTCNELAQQYNNDVTEHYKSCLVNQWSTLGITRVCMCLFFNYFDFAVSRKVGKVNQLTTSSECS